MNKGLKVLNSVTVSKIGYYTKTDLELIGTIDVDGAKEPAELLIDGSQLEELLKYNGNVGIEIIANMFNMWVYPTASPAIFDLEAMFGKPIELIGRIEINYCGADNVWLVDGIYY